jgi:hypothetical protein
MTKRLKLLQNFDGVVLVLLLVVVILAYRDFGDLRGIVLSPVIEYKKTSGLVTVSGGETIGVGMGQTREFAEIIYRYSVDGKAYESNQINYAGDMYRVDYYLDKYPVGKNVSVFYSETFPSISALEPDNLRVSSIGWLLITTMLLILYPKFLGPIITKLEQKYEEARPKD